MIDKIKIYLNSIYKNNEIFENIDTLFNSNWRFEKYTDKQKEVINSTIDFFYFYKDINNHLMLEEIYITIENEKQKNKIFFLDDESFYITIIIFKSFLYYSPIYISNFGGYKNSDKLLDYCVELYSSYCVFFEIETPKKKKIRAMFYIWFHILVKKGIVEEKKIKINKFLNKFWKININEKIEYDQQNFKISYVPFLYKKKENDTFLVGMFFWNVYDIYTKNFYSDTKFNITKEEYLDLLIKRELYIDVEHFDKIKKMLIINKSDLDFLNKELMECLNIENWNIQTRNKIENIQKQYSKKIEDVILHNFLNTSFNEKDRIYFPFYFDFRGRKYYNSVVGPTQNKVLRFIYHYGWYERNDFSNIIKIERILYFKEIIINFCRKNNFEYNDFFIETYFWIFISIGKIKINKSNVIIHDTELIKTGIDVIENSGNLNLDLYDNIEIMHYKEIIKSLKSNQINKIKKRIIAKDGTASVYQVSMLLLHPKNQNALKWVNLYNENCWVDTYSYIINKFKENNKIEENFSEILTRKIAKKTLMTIPYSIGEKNSYKYFLECLKENNIEYEKINNLKKNYNKFYTFVKKVFEKKFLYQKDSLELTNKIMEEYLKERSILIFGKTGETDLSYKKMQKKTIDLIFEMKINEKIIKERVTKLIKTPSKSIDYEQTNISLGANLRHFYEADLLRITEIYLNYSINTIHDAELIDFNSCSKLILIKNRIFKELLKDYDIESNFIII